MNRRFPFCFVLSFFIFISTFQIVGQESYAVKNFTTENGLPHNHVYSIAQDRNGFLWIATFDGLSRWNGYEFRNYYHNPDDSTTISYFQTEEIHVDVFNNVWVGSVHFLSKYNRAADNYIRFNQFDWYNQQVLDNKENFWASNPNGALVWNNLKHNFDPFQCKFSLQNEVHSRISLIGFDNEGQMWFTNFGIYEYQYFYRISLKDSSHQAKYLGKWNHEPYLKMLPAVPKLNIKPIIGKNGNAYILSNYGVFRLDSSKMEFFPDPTFDPEIQLKGSNKNFISGVKEYLQNMLPVISMNNQNPSSERVTENYLVDHQKNVWISYLQKGGAATGLTRKVPTPGYFKHYFLGFNPPNSLNPFFPVLKDKYGTVWGGATNQNKFFLLEKNGKEQQIVPMDGATWKIALRPRAFLEDTTGIWIGYFGGVLLRYEYASKKFTTELLKTTGIIDQSLPHSTLHLKKFGNQLLIVGFKDIFLYNPYSMKFTVLKHFSATENMNMYSVLQDRNNNWWIGGSLNHLLFFGKDFQEMKTYHVGKGEFNIEDLVEGDNNDLWISTLGGGLVHYEIATGKSKTYTTADGLSNNTCYGMLKDKHGNLWISTNHGISRFNPKTGIFRAFGPTDGLKIDEFNSDNSYQAPDGELFFAGMGGVVSFYPDSIISENNSNSEVAPLVIEDFMVSGVKRFFRKPVYECDSIELKQGDNNFQVTFACLDFRNAEKIKYRYRLLGENDEFVQADFRHRFLNYTNLSPGEYRLEIEATNRDGDWVSKAALMIVIPAIYYQTVWFRILIILLLALFIGYMVYSYNHRIRLQARQQQEELRLESLRGQMNPHFIFNSLNSINYFISQNDRLSANRYIADFSRLIRSILGNMSNDYILLSKELESLHDYLKLEHLRFGDKFDYSVVVANTIKPDELFISPGMIQPFIENAIWHGVRGLEDRKGKVKVEFIWNDNGNLQCMVEDDGIGRKRSEKCKSNLPGKTSRGIGIVLERLKIINNLRNIDYQINIVDMFPALEETGTRVTIDIPVKKG